MSSQKLSGLEMWNELVELAHQAKEWPAQELATILGVEISDLKEYLSDIGRSDSSIEFFRNKGHDWVRFDPEQLHFILPLNYQEWKALKGIFTTVEDPQLAGLKEKLTGVRVGESHRTSFAAVDEIHLLSVDTEVMSIIQQSIKEETSIRLQLKSNKTLELFANRLIHLEGQMCLIAEDVVDHCLTAISLTDISEIHEGSKRGNAQASSYEIEEFVMAIRSMGDQETRLILKIHEPDTVNLFPDYHFLGKPCMVKNPNGDLIWAAYVEPCAHLYEWLIGLGRRVEILDPVSFKQDYLDYCEEKLRNIA